MDDLVERARAAQQLPATRAWADAVYALVPEMADRIEALEADLARAEAKLEEARAYGLREAAEIVARCSWGDHWMLDGDYVSPIDVSDTILARAAEREGGPHE